MYVIVSFVGEFPVNSQPYWNKEYRNMGEAVKRARLQHKILERSNYDLYTVVIDKENDEFIECIIYKEKEIHGRKEATKLADFLYQEN
jgi:hypothetical protein